LERHAKNALRALPDVQPSEQLIRSLLALAEPGGPLPSRQVPPAPTSVAAWRLRDSRPRSGPAGGAKASGPARAGRRRAMRLLGVGAGSTAAVLLFLASLGGAPGGPGSGNSPASIVPPLEQ